MCGRYSFEFDSGFYPRYRLSKGAGFPSSYNISPGQKAPVITVENPEKAQLLQWGLVPFWEEKKEKPHGLINIRKDTLAKGWMHKYLPQRCIIPATGFYEWKREGKWPYYFRLKDREYFSFPGIYDNGTYALFTTQANGLMAPIHDRMPAILKEGDEAEWLNPDRIETEDIGALLYPYPESEMDAYPVSKRINTPENNDRGLLEKSQPDPTLF